MTEFHPQLKAWLWAAFAALTLLPLAVTLPTSLVFLATSTVVVALGALHSVVLKEGVRERGERSDEDVLDLSAALQFPLYAGGALICLYLLFQSVEGDLLVRLFRAQFVLLAHSLLAAFAEKRLGGWLPDRPLAYGLTTHRVVAHASIGAICLAYFLTVHWALNNLLGGALAIVSIASMRVSRPHILLLLHALLFLYDIFFVFGTEVMVGVAQWLEAPIKLKLPHAGRFSALGLGDLVVPGLLAALAAKFDVDRALARSPSQGRPRLPALSAVVGGYALGMLITMIAMRLSATAQPALLYLVPGTWLVLAGWACGAKQLGAFFGYHAEPPALDKPKAA